MSIRTRGAPTGEEVPPGTICSYCHHEISAIGVFWMGAGADLWLHDQCTAELAIRLLRDVHEIECRTHSYITRMPWREGADR